MEAFFALISALSKDERLVGKAEGLNEHHHHDGYLVIGTVDTEAVHSLRVIRDQRRIQDFVYGLVHDSGNAQHQQRRRVHYHRVPQTAIETPAEASQLGQQHHQRQQ